MTQTSPIVEYCRYVVDAERAHSFVQAYARAQAELESSPHCLDFELTRGHEEPSRFILRIVWDSLDGHEKGFRGSEEFRRFLPEVRPFIDDLEEMKHYTATPVRRQPTICEAVGGAATFFRIARLMHERMRVDDVLGPLFAGAASTHVPHLGMWLTEVFGGPPLYSAALGNIGPMLERHANKDIAEPSRARFVEVAVGATADCLPADQSRALEAIRRYFEWGSRVAVANSLPDHVPDPEAGVPTWDWDAEG